MPTIAEFIKANSLSMSTVQVEQRTDDNGGNMSRHFLCTVRKWVGGKNPPSFTLFFSQGDAHKKPPTLADVLDCLASDGNSIHNASGFEDWASDLGYDPDSRKAFDTYEQIATQSRKLETLLGTEAYEELLFKVERL